MTNMPNAIRNALAMLAILGIATFMLAACGGGNGNGEPPPPCPEGQVRAGEGGRCIPRTQPRCGEGEVRQGEMCIRRSPPQTRGSIPDQTLTVGGTVTIDLSSYFTHPDGDRLTYSLAFSEGQENQVRASVSGDSLRIQGVTPPGPTIRVYARDPSGSRAYQDFAVRVSADGGGGGGGEDANRDPQTRGSIPDQALRVGGTVTIDLSRYFTDPDGDRLTYSLTYSGGQASQVRASVSGDSLRIQGVAPPGQNVGVNARDPDGGLAYQEVAVRVTGYAALAFGTSGRRHAWAFEYGNSAAEARSDALSTCARLLGSSCRDWGTFTNACRAIAVSECPSDSCSTPAHGAANGRTRREAETAAIAACERAAARVPSTRTAGTCRVDTGDEGEPGVVCLGVE